MPLDPVDADDHRSVRWRPHEAELKLSPTGDRVSGAKRETPKAKRLPPAHRFAEVSGLRSGSYVSFACCFASEEECS